MSIELVWTQARPSYHLVKDGEIIAEVEYSDLLHEPLRTINSLLEVVSHHV